MNLRHNLWGSSLRGYRISTLRTDVSRLSKACPIRYRLRTLLIVLAVGPPLAACGWSEYAKYCERQRQREAWRRELEEIER